MAYCRWKLGCVIYWGVLFCCIAFLITLHIQRQDILQTETYLTCLVLLKVNFSVIIFFALVGLVFTKSTAVHPLLPLVVFLVCIALLMLSSYTLFFVETATFPELEDAVLLLRASYAADPTVFNSIQSNHKCCGMQNYTDWFSIIPDNDLDATSSSRSSWNSGPQAAAPHPSSIQFLRSSCCKKQTGSCENLDGIVSNASFITREEELEDFLFTQGCYTVVRDNFLLAYQSLRSYGIIALLLVLTTAVIFYYFWWRKTATLPQPRCWPAPPLTVNTVVYDPNEGFILACINPFTGAATAPPPHCPQEQNLNCQEDCMNNNNSNNQSDSGKNRREKTVSRDSSSRSDSEYDERNNTNTVRDPPVKIISIV